MPANSEKEARNKVWELIKDIRIATFVTHDENGQLHGRPMAAKQGKFDNELWFFTRDDSPKIKEIEKNSSVLLCYSEPKDQKYVSISGKAEIIRDKNKIKELWSEFLRTWFPKGPDDAIALIKVSADAAEYWDSPSAAIVYAYGYIKAVLTGESPDVGENDKVNLKRS